MDAAVELPGFQQKLALHQPSRFAFILLALLVKRREYSAAGHTPDVYYNGHLAYETLA